MMNENTKKASDSCILQYQNVTPQDLNVAGRLFGGQLMSWIDVVAGIVACRFAECACTTASVDYLSFHRPIYLSALLSIEGRVTYVGNSSMEIRVDTYLERIRRPRVLANRAYLTYVAIDDKGQPLRVPRLELETDEERREWEAGIRRAEVRRARRTEAEELEANRGVSL